MRRLLGGPAVAVGLTGLVGLTACGGTATTAPTSAPTSTAPSSSSVTAAAGGCGPNQLKVADVGRDASAGHLAVTLRVTDVSAVPCTVRGFFGAAGYADGVTAFDQVAHDGDASTVRLHPGISTQVVLSVATIGAGGGACPRVTSLHLTPPGQTAFVTVTPSSPFPACPYDRSYPRITAAR